MRPSKWADLNYYKTDLCVNLLDECPDQIERIHCKDLTVEDFNNKYQKANKPIIIQGLDETCFPIKKYWTFNVSFSKKS